MLTRPNLPDKRMLRIAALPGLLLALCACFGFCLIAYDRVPYASPLLWAAALGLTLVCTLLFCALWLALAKAEALLERAKPRFSGLFGRQWLLWLLILLCWTPCWLAVFPGNFAYDTGGEYDQCAFGFSRAYPRLHSWLNIEIINRSFGLTGSFNAGVALFTLLHMALLALLFSWMLRRLHRLGLNGRPGSAQLRRRLAQELHLPPLISRTDLQKTTGFLLSREELEALVSRLTRE